MHAPLAIVVRTAGTNCDAELLRAFTLAGARAKLVHLDALIDAPQLLEDADLIGFPGGFSYGDDIASGRIFAAKLKAKLWPALRAAVARGVPMIGACNGFQILVQSGLLPGPAVSPAEADTFAWPDHPPEQELALAHNAGGRFIDRWCGFEVDSTSRCLWTAGLNEEFGSLPASVQKDIFRLPIAHGEGRVVARTPDVIERLRACGQIPLRYTKGDNPNASVDDIIGICDPSGRVFGLMPHPERFLDWNRHPFWTSLEPRVRSLDTPGLRMFKNAVRAAMEVKTS
jgi:phosphoribosylformylglycinamidine synthase I